MFGFFGSQGTHLLRIDSRPRENDLGGTKAWIVHAGLFEKPFRIDGRELTCPSFDAMPPPHSSRLAFSAIEYGISTSGESSWR